MRDALRVHAAAFSAILILWGCAAGVPHLRIDKGYPDFRLAKTIMGEHPPMRLAVVGKRAYAIPEEGDEVVVLDLERRLVEKHIPVGKDPMGLVVTANRRFTWVTNHHSDGVSIIDNTKGEVIKTLSMTENPCGIALSPDGRHVYVTHHGGDRVSVVNVETFETEAVFGVGVGPMAVTLTPDGRWAYVANDASNDVSVVSTVSFREIHRIPVALAPKGIAASTDGRVYVANSGSSSLSVIDVDRQSVVRTIPLPHSPIRVEVVPSETGGYSLVVW